MSQLASGVAGGGSRGEAAPKARRGGSFKKVSGRSRGRRGTHTGGERFHIARGTLGTIAPALDRPAPRPKIPRMLAQPRYNRTAVALHWLIALLMAVNIALILLVERFPEDWVRPVV